MKKASRYLSIVLVIATILCLQATAFAATKPYVGTLVTFGAYEQDGKKSNGQEDIQWIVLAVRGDKALLISRYILDCRPYNKEWADITWEECTLRTWLNDTFLETAFSASEQNAIMTTEVDNSREQGNQVWNKRGGYDTKDKVFLLSYQEAKEYFDNDKDRISKPTEYAATRGVWKDKNKAGHWWLRSPGKTQNYAAYTSSFGSLSSTYDYNTAIGVRPAMWVDVNALR